MVYRNTIFNFLPKNLEYDKTTNLTKDVFYILKNGTQKKSIVIKKTKLWMT